MPGTSACHLAAIADTSLFCGNTGIASATMSGASLPPTDHELAKAHTEMLESSTPLILLLFAPTPEVLLSLFSGSS